MIRNLFRGLVILLAMAAMTGPSGAQQQAPQQQPAAQTAPAAAPNAASPEQPKATQTPAQAPRAAPAPDAAAQPAPAEAATQPAAPPPPPAEPKAEEPPPELRDLLAPIDRASDEMDDVLKKLKEIKRDDDALAKLRNRVEDIRARAQAAADPLAPRLEAIKALTAKLGPVPDKDSPPDTPQIAAERKRLKAFESGIDGALKASDLVQARAHQILTLIQQRRREIFTGDLLRRSRSPLTPVIWKQVAAELPGALSQIKDVGRFWMSAASTRPFKLGSLLAGVLFAYILLRAGLRRIVQARLNDSAGPDRPSFFERAATAGGVAPILAVPPLAAVLGLYFGLDNLGLLYGQVENVAASTVFASLVYIGVSALSTAVLQPRHSNWRLLDIADRPAGRLTAIVKLIALVYGADAVLKDLIQNLTLPLPVSVAQAFIASLAFAALLVQIVRTRFDPLTPSDMAVPVSRMRPYAIKIPLLLVALAIIATSLLGYVALGRFIAGQVVVTGSVIVLALLLHLAIRALTTEEHPEWLPQPAWLRQQSFGLETSQRRTIIRVVAFLLNVLLALLAIPFILITWGFSLPETLGWLRAAIFGFEIGQFRISLARIFLAVVLFAALYFVTRIVQRWLQSSVLQPSRLDQGIANSIYTGVGYAGIAVAALAAISFGGIDITNLAIVAGALSVGIGFGLQSIVNNFVSGLILLVERPIKVGDWIVVKDHEGYVRRISVRSTELETFDRASVILPNSDLIANPVKNWTHRNLLGRAIIKVSVATTANADKVMEILKEVASKTENILPHPAPFVSFDNISPNSFDFSVGIYVADINRAGGAQTELRAAILRAFTEAGIELPNTKQHVYLRDLDFLKAVMMRVIEQRAGSGPTADRPDEEDENTDGAGAMRKN
jgi:potassium efflux system protein